jgi:hypothetical protein
MRYARYLRMEKYIAASDTGGILERWRCGRRLLEDGDATTPAGNLKHGVLERLLTHARTAGYPITDREIQYRLRCARAYASEAEIRTACSDFKTWSDLRAASFPAVQVSLEADTEPFDPRDADEKRRDAARELERREREEGGEQIALFDHFPAERFDRLATIAELRKYADEMAGWTERQAEADRRRTAYVDRLSAAVAGDESKTWAEAHAALTAA